MSNPLNGRLMHNVSDMTIEQLVFRIVVIGCIAKTYGIDALTGF